MRKLILVIALLVVLVSGALAVVNFAFDETTVKTHTVAESVREIVVTSDSGDVDLIPAAKQVEVRETQHYVLSKPTLRRNLMNDVLRLDSDCNGKLVKCYIDLRISVPAGIEVTVEADSGDVDAREM